VAVALAAHIREGSVTSAEVVDAQIGRIQGVNRRLNAVVRERFDVARWEADAMRVELASGRRVVC
jgi:Asp-tRNA(Asn)/Glu-tRNA(Gln) amidotransferase A subunit family amidase